MKLIGELTPGFEVWGLNHVEGTRNKLALKP